MFHFIETIEQERRNYRRMFVGVDKKIPLANGKYIKGINFDNAATTPPFRSVMKEIQKFAPWYSSVHRGKGYKSVITSEVYEKGRDVIKRFVQADKELDTIIYTKNSTEAINVLAHILSQEGRNDVILATGMEHLANDLPWRDRFSVDYIEVDPLGRLSLADLKNKLVKHQGKVKLVTVTGASNVTGYLNLIHAMAAMAHEYGALIHVDGAQLTPHHIVDLKPHSSPEHIDFFTFTGHKMYAPFGIGVLIGMKEVFRDKVPLLKGGGSVRLVSTDFVEWDEAPAKEEAGTPNIMGIVALMTAIRTLESLGMDTVHEYESNLVSFLFRGLKSIPHCHLFGPDDKEPDEERVSLISFYLEGINHHAVAQALSDEFGIAVRSGWFCAYPYVQKLLQVSQQDLQTYRQNPDLPGPGLVRISLGLYNRYHEVAIFLDALDKIASNRDYYQQKYDINYGICGRRK